MLRPIHGALQPRKPARSLADSDRQWADFNGWESHPPIAGPTPRSPTSSLSLTELFDSAITPAAASCKTWCRGGPAPFVWGGGVGVLCPRLGRRTCLGPGPAGGGGRAGTFILLTRMRRTFSRRASTMRYACPSSSPSPVALYKHTHDSDSVSSQNACAVLRGVRRSTCARTHVGRGASSARPRHLFGPKK